MHSAFDRLNRLFSVTNADLSTIRNGQGDQDELTDVTDERNLVAAYVRNGWGCVIQEDSPDRSITDYERESAGGNSTYYQKVRAPKLLRQSIPCRNQLLGPAESANPAPESSDQRPLC